MFNQFLINKHISKSIIKLFFWCLIYFEVIRRKWLNGNL